MKAWHFVGATLRDGRPVPKDGEKLIFHGDPILCERGFHFSLHPFDALKYAPGETLCLVECGGKVVMGDDKGVCTERTIVARMDASEMLRYFARMQALSVAHLWDAPNVMLDWLMTGDESLSAAAWDAASAAAWAAASAAARAAAWAAARAAAWDAAWDAAWAAAWAAARAAASAAAWDNFKSLVHECFGIEGELS